MDGEKYYAMPDGTLRVGWLSFGSTYYYCGSDAAIVKGLQKIDGLYYYFDEETGVQQARTAGWHTIKGREYYTMPDGGLRVGWFIVWKHVLLLRIGRGNSKGGAEDRWTVLLF